MQLKPHQYTSSALFILCTQGFKLQPELARGQAPLLATRHRVRVKVRVKVRVNVRVKVRVKVKVGSG